MRLAILVIGLLASTLCAAADVSELPTNTFLEIKFTHQQPPDVTEDTRGRFAALVWNKLVYDPDGKRVLMYDRWVDKKHGGFTIYGNCLFAFDLKAETMTPLKIDHWTRIDVANGGYRTQALPENESEPTPAPRHTYHAFEYVSDLKSVFLCNGANQTVIDKNGKLVGHDECDGAWRLDLTSGKWMPIKSTLHPVNRLDDAMAYSPEVKSLVYAGFERQIWILDLATGEWRKSKQSPPPRPCMGQSIYHDPTSKRMLIVGGGRLDAWEKGPAPEYRELYAYDPAQETVKRLGDGPTAFYGAHLAFDSRRKLFFTVAAFNKQEQPSGMFTYDPVQDAWKKIHVENEIPPHKAWCGWMALCYDAHHDCLIGRVGDRFFAFRYAPRE